MDGYDNWTLISENVSSSSTQPNPNSTHNNNSVAAALMPFNVFTLVVYISVFIVGLLGNTLVIYVVIRYTKMKTVTNLYILNLALADELYILGIPFLGTNSVLSYWPYGDLFCKVYMTADAMSQFSSTFCLTVMSIDRYLAVVHPIRSVKWRKPQVAKIFNGVVWVVSFLIVLPVTIYSHVQEEVNACNITWPEPHKFCSIVFILYTSILGFFGPLVVICLCYLLIVIKVRSAGVRAGRTKRRKSERKNNTNVTVYFFLVILTYVNSCANPILYAFLSDNFRQSFQKVLCVHKPNGVGTASQMGGRNTAYKENHIPVLPTRNPTQNGKMQSIQETNGA
ncbi:somatostatin receptor type 5-like isoform X3 [Cyclopterus lumpus]|uniref:somatostatin receptor type 5-like isoform X3 n=1 Tax=Cyclopterus lumpus TaxID=8103 RepID=UPI00148696AA|nr:somatostatin receptor type 5-like isoform X3 [Cyclopterus lumpus]